MTAFHSFRNRPEPELGSKVRVYRNLNRPSLFSIVALEGEHKGRVLGYAAVVGLANVSLKVSEKQRQGVLKKQVRTVHAYAEGDIAGLASELPGRCVAGGQSTVTYQPYLAGHFFDRQHPDTPVWDLPEAWTSGANLVVPR